MKNITPQELAADEKKLAFAMDCAVEGMVELATNRGFENVTKEEVLAKIAAADLTDNTHKLFQDFTARALKEMADFLNGKEDAA